LEKKKKKKNKGLKLKRARRELGFRAQYREKRIRVWSSTQGKEN
jgi:hypothetical protein